ncbi:hypothetical protein EMCRGX_G034379 [Ephydatia muelleri]|eukprot:Em0023g313a
MENRRTLIVACLTLVVVAINSQTPVPSRPSGYVYQSSSNPKVVVEVFYDHLCVDSAANYPTLLQVFSAYADQGVAGIIHIFPLPYHHNAFFMQWAGTAIRAFNSDKFMAFTTAVFQNQNTFLTEAVNMTEIQVKNTIAQFVETNVGISADVILEGFQDSTLYYASVYDWKYAASRTITGTPQFIVNGVVVPDAQGYNFAQWKTFIDGLLGAGRGV